MTHPSPETAPPDAPTAVPARSIAQDAVFRPVRGGNAFEETVERLLQAIKLGVVTYGERLPTERALSARLKVSRVTLREAIRSLQQAGYVESRRGRTGGTFVTYRPADRPVTGEVSATDATVVGAAQHGPALADILTLREVLEVGAAEMAARRRPAAAERDLLGQRLADVEGAAPAEFRQMDSRLHLAIAELSGSTALASMVADVRMRINALLDAMPLLSPNLDHSVMQHRAMVAAILAGDEVAARTTTREHLDGTAALLRGFFG